MTRIRWAVLWFVFLGGLPSFSLPADSSEASLTVLLFNNSHASLDTLSLTKEAIDSIFRKSGIRLVWTDCPPVHDSVGAQLCRDESVPGEIRVRIVDRQLKHYVADNAFGFAIPPVWATVYYEPALRLARSTTDSESNVSIILGCLIAHEIGHLLLGKDQHTASGIMMARWDIQQIQQVMKGTLRFSRQQAERMRINVHTR